MRWFNKLFVVAFLFVGAALAQNLGPPSGGAGSGTVTNVTCFGTAITSSGTCTTAAAKADEQAGTSPTLVVTPSQQQQHDSAAKVWISFNGLAANCSVTCTINASYNVSSVTRSGTGTYVVNFTTAFSSANFSCQTSNNQSAGATGTKAASSIQIFSESLTALADASDVNVTCYGRQ